MARMTTFSKFLITLLIVAAVYFGFRYFVKNTDTGQNLAQKGAMAQARDNTDNNTRPNMADNGGNTDNNGPTNSNLIDFTPGSFSYDAPLPNSGVLKGIVVCGAQGFDSFIIRVDESGLWQCEDKKFGTTLIKEGLATDADIADGLKAYITKMINFGVPKTNIHFVVSSGALKDPGTRQIIKAIQKMRYVVNEVSPSQEGQLGFKCAVPKDFYGQGFLLDIGSGNTKIAWKYEGKIQTAETLSAKYFQDGVSAQDAANQVENVASRIPQGRRKICFILGGVPSDLAKLVRKGEERYTVLNAPAFYAKIKGEKQQCGLNIYNSVAKATGCEMFVFDWDSNFSIGQLLPN